MERFSDLDVLLDHVWSYVHEASTDRHHPFRTPTFGTAGFDTPNVRTVVLRDADPDARVLGFHSDVRSDKVAEIRAEDGITWHGWDRDRSQQLRLSGTATVHTNDAYADALWNATRPEERMLYLASPPPGTPVSAPSSGLPDDAEAVADDDPDAGRDAFCAIRTVIDEISFLHLHPEGHYRARFRYAPETEIFDGDWIIP